MADAHGGADMSNTHSCMHVAQQLQNASSLLSLIFCWYGHPCGSGVWFAQHPRAPSVQHFRSGDDSVALTASPPRAIHHSRTSRSASHRCDQRT
jgi:hypothetical protein